MKVVVHDLEDELKNRLRFQSASCYIIDATKPYAPCKGCFGCWLKTPGKCVMADKLEKSGAALLQADELIIITKCLYGGYSAAVKKVMDRSISGVLPFFVEKQGEMHHAARYHHKIKLKVYFYNPCTDHEKELAQKLVAANGINFWAETTDVHFITEDMLCDIAL